VPDAARLVLSFGGIGFLPGPSGTWASLATTAIVVAFHGFAPAASAPAVLAAVAGGVVATLLLGGRTAAPTGHGDPSWVVTDEVAGQGIALALAGLSAGRGLVTTIAAFVLFRLLDITKPGPIRAAERLPGGLGILADDLLAGVGAGAAAFALGTWAVPSL
jgi:phosphatidylglycerophosphatase A